MPKSVDTHVKNVSRDKNYSMTLCWWWCDVWNEKEYKKVFAKKVKK